MTDPGKASPGFTLFELLVVMAIMSAFMALALPSISTGFGSLSARSAANEISSTLTGARERALRERATFYAEVSNGRLAIKSSEGKTVEHTFAPGVELAPGPALSFYPSGASSGGEIRLTSGGLGYAVIVLPSGRPKVEAVR